MWNVAEDDALQTLEAVATGSLPWGRLFWVVLMAGASEDAVIARWREVVTARVEERRLRANLAGIALIFAGLVGRRLAWNRGLEGFEMTESEVVNEWLSQGEARGRLAERRESILRVLQRKFAGLVSGEVKQLIQQQDSLLVLDDWFDAAISATSVQEFLTVLRR